MIAYKQFRIVEPEKWLKIKVYEGLQRDDQDFVYLPRQHLTKWSKTQYLCGIAATGAGLLSTFYQH